MRVKYVHTYFPEYAPAERDFVNRGIAYRAKLYAGKLTIGQYQSEVLKNRQALDRDNKKVDREYEKAIGTMLC